MKWGLSKWMNSQRGLAGSNRGECLGEAIPLVQNVGIPT